MSFSNHPWTILSNRVTAAVGTHPSVPPNLAHPVRRGDDLQLQTTSRARPRPRPPDPKAVAVWVPFPGRRPFFKGNQPITAHTNQSSPHHSRPGAGARDDPGGDRGGADGGVHGAGGAGAGAAAPRRALPAPHALPHAPEPPLRRAAAPAAATRARAPRRHTRLNLNQPHGRVRRRRPSATHATLVVWTLGLEELAVDLVVAPRLFLVEKLKQELLVNLFFYLVSPTTS